jgi:glycine/D-amino acid oxidase-like deaminating enzyme
MRVAVIGAGIHGSCTALSLADRGHDVTLFDQFGFGPSRGSSKGATRIVRQAYPDAFHAKILLDAHPMWRSLEQRIGQTIYNECGLLYFGSDTDADIVGTAKSLAQLDVPFESLDPKETMRRWPSMRLSGNEVGIFTPEAGYVLADKALGGIRRLAAAQGAQLTEQKVTQLQGFDKYIVTTGSWIEDFAPFPVEVRRHTFAYIKGLHHGPAFIEAHPIFPYGFSTEPGADTFKIGIHMQGAVPDGPHEDFQPDPAAIELIREAASRRFGIANPEITQATGCPYTVAKDDLFKLKWIDDNAIAASPCSGHGFKFGPWIGELLADLIEGKQTLSDWPEFEVG